MNPTSSNPSSTPDPKQDAPHVIFAQACNGSSFENDSNTPDFILGDYLARAFGALNEAIRARDTWYGLKPSPGSGRWVRLAHVQPLLELLEELKDLAPDFLDDKPRDWEEEGKGRTIGHWSKAIGDALAAAAANGIKKDSEP